jgi:hypothetical protein
LSHSYVGSSLKLLVLGSIVETGRRLFMWFIERFAISVSFVLCLLPADSEPVCRVLHDHPLHAGRPRVRVDCPLPRASFSSECPIYCTYTADARRDARRTKKTSGVARASLPSPPPTRSASGPCAPPPTPASKRTRSTSPRTRSRSSSAGAGTGSRSSAPATGEMRAPWGLMRCPEGMAGIAGVGAGVSRLREWLRSNFNALVGWY